MTYSIVYSSKTGNTRMLAEALAAFLPEEDRVYMGEPVPQAQDAERIYVGFWTDKGTCDPETAAFLAELTTQEVFLFGTAGFGGSADYFEKILAEVKQKLSPQVRLIGTYMCQGKMPQGVRRRYEAMEESPRRQMLLDNFDQALSHPDEADLQHLKAAVEAVA